MYANIYVCVQITFHRHRSEGRKRNEKETNLKMLFM